MFARSRVEKSLKQCGSSSWFCAVEEKLLYDFSSDQIE